MTSFTHLRCLLWCLSSRHHLAPVHLYLLLFPFSFCIFFRASEKKKKKTFTAQCLPRWMRQEKSKRASFFPTKALSRVSVPWGDWTHKPEICSGVFSGTSPNLVLLAGRGSQSLSQSCPSSLRVALQHISGWMSQGHLRLRIQRDLMKRKISLLNHMMAFRLLNGVNVNWILKISWF